MLTTNAILQPKILGVSQNLWKCLCKTVNFSVTSKKLCCIWKSVQFSTCWCHSMLTLVFSMDALDAFPIACRRQWRTPNTRVRTQCTWSTRWRTCSPKAEMQYWGHCGIGNVLPKIVKLPTFISASRAKRCAWITSRREEALLRKRALLSKFARVLLLDEKLSMRIFWRVRRWWMSGSLTIFGRTLPIPQCPQYCISAFGGTCSPSGVPRALCALGY